MWHKNIFQITYDITRKKLIKKIKTFASSGDEIFANQRGKITFTESEAIDIDVHRKLGCQESDLVLEISCGTGLLARKIANGLKIYIGLDVVKALLCMAKEKNALANTHFLQADAQTLPIKNRLVDRLLIYNVILQLPPRIFKSILKECKRVLKPDGVMLIGDIPNPDKLIEFAKKQSSVPWRIAFLAAERAIILRLKQVFNLPGGGWYRPKKMEKILRKEGFVGTILPQAADCPWVHYRYDVLARVVES
jgi:ubiquinone/menaquinone biosynthesis C-methylase UbiE